MDIQAFGGTYDEETGEVTLIYRDVATDPNDWTQKVRIEVRIPSEFVTFVDLTPEPEQLPVLPTPPEE